MRNRAMLNPINSILKSKNRNGGGVEFDIPDEIAVEILSRLPAKDVARLQSVCKRWRDLTSSPYFHLQLSLPMLIGEQFPRVYGLYLVDQWWKPPPSEPIFYEFGNRSLFSLLFSNGGLVIMRHFDYQIYRIINPIYHEKVHITLSVKFFVSSDIYGVFFHPSLNEYCTLWMIYVSKEVTRPTVETKQVECRMLTLGSKPCWRVIINPWSHKAKISGINPILIHEHLYWAVYREPDSKSNFPADVMEFDIRKEKFAFIPSPVLGAVKCYELDMNLLDIGGVLSWVWISLSEKAADVNIWTLKDPATQLWTSSSCCINMDAFYWHGRPISLVNDELILPTNHGPFICNLKLHTSRKFKDKSAPFLRSHLMSLSSLRNCTPNIYIDDIGEVKKYRKRSLWDMSSGVDEILS